MPSLNMLQTNFTAGEVSSRLLGRGDLRAYDNGALTLRNVFIEPTGGISRRAGLYYIATLSGPARLVEFEFNTEQTYLLVFLNHEIQIFQNDTFVVSLTAPWNYEQLSQINWSQNADTLLVTHPDLPPRKITRTLAGWTIDLWPFYTGSDNVNYQPYYKFADAPVTITSSATTGLVTLTASANIFVSAHNGTRFRIAGKEVIINDVLSPTIAKANVVQTLAATTATLDWQEQAFSAVHGWPVSCAFHQDRLVIGGSRDLPNRLWLSCSGDIFNFDLGTALDDEAIEFAIVSDQVNAIRAVFSGRHLQIFTSGAEWMVTGSPLTPRNLQISRQTRIGSVASRTIPPVDVDGATLFVARDGREIREFIYTDVEQAYQSNDLSLLAPHLLTDPLEIAFDKSRRILCIVRADGFLATLTIYRAEAIVAWSLLDTVGDVQSVAVVDNQTYLLIKRGADYFLEKLDDSVLLDSALIGTAVEPQDEWTGLGHLEGKLVRIVADGVIKDDQIVTGGSITLDSAVSSIQVGLPYAHIIEPLPPNATSLNGTGRAMRMISAVFRILQTAALRVDMGRGMKDIALRRLIADDILDEPPEQISGDIEVRAIGWSRDNTKPLWRIEHDAPLPFNLLSTTTNIKVTD